MSKHNNSNQVAAEGAVIRQAKELPNLMTCILAHKTSSTTAEYRWLGGPLNPIWPEVLAFLKWTYEKTHSESQLRLYVNTKTKEWKAWAFPQKANLGMSAKELTEGDEGYARSQEQRAQFNDDWRYYGTVHHHCSTSAFQSGTDTENERNQDGVHITVGNLNSNHYDIHFRLYQSGFKLTSVGPSTFWDVGVELAAIPATIKRMLPNNAADELAKERMGDPPPATQEFPAIWKENIIDITPKQVATTPYYGSGSGSGYGGSGMLVIGKRVLKERAERVYEIDLNRAVKEVFAMCADQANKLTVFQAVPLIEGMVAKLDDDELNLIDIITRNDLMPDVFLKHLNQVIKELQQEVKDQQRMQEEGGIKGKASKQQVLGFSGPQPTRKEIEQQQHPYNVDDWSGYGGY